VIVCELIGSRLANVDIGAARQMLSGEKICAQFVVLWTDPDNRSMATSGRGSGVVGYNVQVAVDKEHHLIVHARSDK
jgi:hypothetical protein